MFTDVGRPSGYSQSEWLFSKNPIENLLEGKPGASSRGNSSSRGVCQCCCG